MHNGCRWENLEESEHLEDLGIEVRITVKYILKKQVRRLWINVA